MKLFVVVFLAALVATACGGKQEMIEKYKSTLKKCMGETGVSMKDLKEAKGQTEPTRKMKCLEACTYETEGLINADGSINLDKVNEEFAGMDKLIEAFNQCAADATPGQDRCDAAHAMTMCLKNKGAKFGGDKN